MADTVREMTSVTRSKAGSQVGRENVLADQVRNLIRITEVVGALFYNLCVAEVCPYAPAAVDEKLGHCHKRKTPKWGVVEIFFPECPALSHLDTGTVTIMDIQTVGDHVC